MRPAAAAPLAAAGAARGKQRLLGVLVTVRELADPAHEVAGRHCRLVGTGDWFGTGAIYLLLCVPAKLRSENIREGHGCGLTNVFKDLGRTRENHDSMNFS